MLGKKAIHYPSKDADLVYFFDHAVKKLESGVGAKYGIPSEVITALRQHSDVINQKYLEAGMLFNQAQAKTAEKREAIRDGNIALKRVLKMIQGAANFEESDAEGLGIRVLSEKPNLREIKPVVKSVIAYEERVEIKWLKKRMEGVIVYSSYDMAKFVEIARVMHTPFMDERKNLTEHPEARYYKLRYFKNDKPVGLETPVTKIIAEIF